MLETISPSTAPFCRENALKTIYHEQDKGGNDFDPALSWAASRAHQGLCLCIMISVESKNGIHLCLRKLQ